MGITFGDPNIREILNGDKTGKDLKALLQLTTSELTVLARHYKQ